MTITVKHTKELNLYAVTATDDSGKEINLEILTKTEMERLTLGEIYRLMAMDI